MAKELVGSEIVLKALQDQEVDVIFGYPGGAVLPIYDTIFGQNSIKHILVRQEAGAIHAAEGYARSSGKVGVVLVTSGPGATNVVTGLTDALMDSIPIVCITGQVPSHLIGSDAFQECDTTGITRPCTKHNYLVKDVNNLSSTIHEAFEIAKNGRPGPVVIDIPKDLTDASYNFKFSYPKEIDIRSYKPVVEGHSGQIKKAVKALLKSKRPIIYSGGGVIQGNASEELTNLVKLLNFPVTNTLMGLGAYPGTDPQFVGMLGMHGTYEANMAIHNSDLILAVGARFDDRITNSPDLFALDSKKIHIDVDPASLSKIIDVDIPIVGSAKTCLGQLIAELEKEKYKIDKESLKPWWEQINNWRKEHGLDHNLVDKAPPKGKILPQQVVQSLYRETKGDAFISSDVGQHQMFAAQYYHFDKPRRWINSGGLGTMGFGLPAAIGVQLAHPGSVVACITGEGSIQMCIQELSTCLQYELPLKIININNQSLGMVKQWQDMQYGGRLSESTYQGSLPDFIALAESFGHVGMKVEKYEDLQKSMEECFKMTDKLVFMDIYVDPDEHVYPMLEAGKSMQDMWLDKDKKTWE